MSKLTKLVNNPELFLRDYLLKKIPLNEKEKQALLPTKITKPAEPKVKPPTPIKKNVETPQKATQDSLAQTIEDVYPITFPIDIVYTWVNSDDPEFTKTRLHYQDILNGTNTEVKNESVDIARFESRDELKYSIRSIFKYAPWVNHIYIVTNGQIPSWLNQNCDKITVISHSQILNSKYLPTFNSHVIESALHKIPNLSEHFIYFNDDVLLTRPLPASYFFTSSGLAKLFITNAKLPNGEKNSNDSPTQWAAKNSRALLLDKTGFWVDTMFAHTFHPQVKSIHQEIDMLWHHEVSLCRKNRFRSDSDLNTASFLHHHLALIRGKAIATRTRCMYFNIRDKQAEKLYANLLANKGTDKSTHSVCLNDKVSNNINALDNFEIKLRKFLDTYYPEATEAEITIPTKNELASMASEKKFVEIYQLINHIQLNNITQANHEMSYLHYYFGISCWFTYQENKQESTLQKAYYNLQVFCENNPKHKLAQDYLKKVMAEHTKISNSANS